MTQRSTMKIEANFSLGGSAAEYDPLLIDAWIHSNAYSIVESRIASKCFLIGRTGTGKSAILRRLEHDHANRVIRMAPENLAFAYITNLAVMPKLVELGVHLDPFLKALWKHVFIVEVLRHRYGITSPEKKSSLIDSWTQRFKRDRAKLEAIAYLSEFGDRFWCEADERVKQVALTFENKFKAAGDVRLPLGPLGTSASGGTETTQHMEDRIETTRRYQAIVNEVQIPRINKMMELLRDEVLDDQHFTYIVIDDLDTNWVDSMFMNLLIRCLFQAVIEMRRVPNLKIVVALRTNIFTQLGNELDPQGWQDEKLFSDFVVDLQWSAAALRQLLAKRAEVASTRMQIEPPLMLDEIVVKSSKKSREPISYILSRTLLRPRDAILFLNECLGVSIGKQTVSMEDIYRAEREYSRGRVTALRDEWRIPYMGLDQVLDCFRRLPARISRAALTEALNQVALLLADQSFPGNGWLEPCCSQIWEEGSGSRTWAANYGKLVQILYQVGFLGLVKLEQRRGGQSTRTRAIYSYDEPELLKNLESLSDSSQFEVQPAFQQALDITQTESWGAY